MTYLTSGNVPAALVICGRITHHADLLAAIGCKVMQPGWSEGPSHKSDLGVFIVEGLVNLAVAVHEIHVLALRKNHNEDLDWKPFKNGDAP